MLWCCGGLVEVDEETRSYSRSFEVSLSLQRLSDVLKGATFAIESADFFAYFFPGLCHIEDVPKRALAFIVRPEPCIRISFQPGEISFRTQIHSRIVQIKEFIVVRYQLVMAKANRCSQPPCLTDCVLGALSKQKRPPSSAVWRIRLRRGLQ